METGSPVATRLIGLLRERSAEFERFWQEQRVAICRGGTKTMLNPRFGSADLQCQILRHEGAAQILVTFTAPPRTPGAVALSRLSGPE